MGLFCCCFRPKVFQSERKRILEERSVRNEVTIIGDPSQVVPSINSSHYRMPTIGLSEQSLFDITVQKMASKMINIPALDNEFPQVFWRDRQKSYAKKVYNIRNPLKLRSDLEKSRPKNESSHHRHLTLYERCYKMETISREDLKLINELSEKSSNAVKKGFEFLSDQSFVVEFDPNKNL